MFKSVVECTGLPSVASVCLPLIRIVCRNTGCISSCCTFQEIGLLPGCLLYWDSQTLQEILLGFLQAAQFAFGIHKESLSILTDSRVLLGIILDFSIAFIDSWTFLSPGCQNISLRFLLILWNSHVIVSVLVHSSALLNITGHVISFGNVIIDTIIVIWGAGCSRTSRSATS